VARGEGLYLGEAGRFGLADAVEGAPERQPERFAEEDAHLFVDEQVRLASLELFHGAGGAAYGAADGAVGVPFDALVVAGAIVDDVEGDRPVPYRLVPCG